MATQPPASRPLKCPTCGRPIEWSEAFPFRPFCSERCRLIDLGAWFTEQRAIPGDPADPAATPPPGPDDSTGSGPAGRH
jgi:endogenous inhibitor of DNA gyrase (YacG/DUF329 family)